MQEIRLPIRHYECDAYGHLNNVSYVRYLEEALLQGDAGRRMLHLVMDYLYPARFGQTVELRMTPDGEDERSLRWACDFRVMGLPDPVAAAMVETIALQSPSEPAQIEIVQQAMDALPLLPAPPPGAYTQRHGVSWQDLDLTRRVSEATMLGFAEDCGMGVIAAHGWPPERMAAEGFAIILRRHDAVFATPACLGEELKIATWVSDVKRISATRHYTIRRVADGMLLARIDTLGVWVDFATGRPIRIPADFARDFAPNVSPAPTRG